jgi:DNA-binding transcriptional regulator YhcF (GntR family)
LTVLELGQIDRGSDRSAYRQIADVLREAIESDRLPSGKRLPSEAELIEHFGVARMTVRQAVQELRSEGLVHSEHGRGVFVRPNPRYVPGGAEIQVGVTTFVGRSHTELARLIAYDHGWRLFGDQIIDEDEVVVADTLEELARKALALGWYDPTGAGVHWDRFGGTKDTNADTIRQFQA